jgi:GNAT superfamily N-acetyltransferase
MSGDRTNPDTMVVPVSAEHWDSLSALFTASRGVDECWCMWPLHPPRTFCSGRTRNRAALKSLIDAGRSPGLVALKGERAVGWCALGPRHEYPQYSATEQHGQTTWAIPCIYIDPTANREDVAGALIEAAAQRAIANHAAFLDGPPPWWSPGDEMAVALATNTFLTNGFTQIDFGARMPVLRRDLARPIR